MRQLHSLMTRKWLLWVSWLLFVPFLSATNDGCPSSCLEPSSAPKNGMRIFYLIIVHNERTLDDAVYLFRAIRDPRNIVVVHVDAKAQRLVANNTSMLQREVKSCPCGSMIRIESIFDVKWSEWSMNEPTLWALELATTEYAYQWDVFVNLSGDTLPVLTVDSMASALQSLGPYNYVTSSSCETGLVPTNVYDFPHYWHKYRHYTRDGTEPVPTITYQDADGTTQTLEMPVHFGSQWNVLQYDFCEWLATELRRPDSLPSRFREYLVGSQVLMTDETFIPALLVNAWSHSLPPVDQATGALLHLPEISAVRYERMDEHYPTAFGYLWQDQRYEVPPSSGVEHTRIWGPYFLGVYDLGNVKESGALFVRKVSSTLDPNMFALLPVEKREDIPTIHWPDEVQLSAKPNWEAKMDEIRRKVKESENGEEYDEDEDEYEEDGKEEEL